MDVNSLVEDTKFVKYVINKCIPCKRMMDMIEQRASYEHNIYCPFHQNTDTPAARMYKNEDGSDSIFCYAEHKMYRSSDFITQGLINSRLESVFYRLWIKLPKEVQETLISNYQGDVSFIPQGFKDSLPQMETFKQGAISITELNQLILDSLK